MSVSDDVLVSIIVISFNTREMTLECLRSVRRETHVPYELIVVDNASEDGSAEAIAAEFPDIDFTASPENTGFALANNMASERARGRYVLLLNPDTVVLDGAIDALVAFAERTPDARIWGGRTLFGDRSLNPTSCWRRLTLWNVFCRTTGLTGLFPKSEFFNSEAYGGWDRGTERQVDVVTGCLMLMTLEDWRALGGFEARFQMYGEEVDLCLRAIRDLGAAPRVTPGATIVHYGGASQKVRADKMVRLMRAKTELIQQHFPPVQRALGKPIFALWPWSRWMASSVLGRMGIKKGQGAEVWREVWQRRSEWRDGFS